MSEFYDNPESLGPRVCENVEEGLSLLSDLAQLKKKESENSLLIVINGMPNSGKTFLGAAFRDKNAKAINLPDPERLEDNHYKEMIKGFDYVTVTDTGERFVIDRKLQRILGRKSDLFAYMYNPNTEQLFSSYAKGADIIIKNSQAEVKNSQSYARH